MKSLDPPTVRRWAVELAKLGHDPIQLSAGVEGAVFTLGDDTVAKVWNSRKEHEIVSMAAFYDALLGADLPFLTPKILSIGRLGNFTFSIERKLPGRPLFPDHTGQSPPLDKQTLTCVATVLKALAAVAPSSEMKILPVLDDPDPLWQDGSFNSSLCQLVSRRVARSLTYTAVAISNIEALAAALVNRLSTMEPRGDGLIHGDLIPANIHVNEHGGVAAVLDFGFFTTVGDPAFDAAVTANIFDMYGPNKQVSYTVMEGMIRDAFGYSQDVISVYTAAYAMATMTLFGSSEADGHFHWCAEVLRRPDVLRAL
jgi:Phosphotransferase enzyme family